MQASRTAFICCHRPLFVSAFAICAMACSVNVQGQVASALLTEGGQFSGAPVGHLVNSISNPAVNHAGGFSFAMNSSDGVTTLSHIWGNASGGVGTVMRTEGVFDGHTQTAFESFHGIANDGTACYSPTVGAGDSVFVGDVSVAVDGEAHPTLAGMFWVFGSRPGITAGGTPYFSGGIGPAASTTNRGLFYGADGGTVLLLGGQTPTNFPRALSTGVSQPSFSYRLSANGTNYIGDAQMIAPTGDDVAVVINSAGLMVNRSLVQESKPIPAAAGGQAGENWVNFDFFGITENGTYFFTGDSNLATTADEFIFKNGQMYLRDGSVLGGSTLQGDIEAAYMNEQGDIAAVWDIDGGTFEALILNKRIVLTEGQRVDLDNDGTVEANSILRDFTGIASLAVSDRDFANDSVHIFFTADIDVNGTASTLDDIEGGFAIVVPLCSADTNNDSNVNVTDLLAVISAWGPCVSPPCAADTNGDGQINVTDLLAVISAWGPCP